MSAPAAPPLFRLTGGSDFPDKLKCLISGPPKAGKTSLLGTVPNIVIADTEPHANNLQSVAHKNLPYVPILGTPELQRLLFVLRDDGLRAKAAEQLGMPRIEAVGLDTVDTLQKIMKRERMRETRQSKFMRDDWGWLKDELVAILQAFTALPLHVFFVVHTKTVDLGTEDDKTTIVLPGLQGGIDEEIAGMVGYSLLSFRKEEIRPDGSPYTKYWLRAEGNDTYQFVGNRAAGRLPDVIEPDFRAIYDAAMAGRQAIQTPVQPAAVEGLELQRTEPAAAQVAQNAGQPASVPAPAAPAPVPAPTPAAEPPAAPVPAPAQAPTEPTEPAAPAAQPAPAQPAAAADDSDQPINAAALGFTQRVYAAAGLEFPEQIIQGLTLGEARTLVRMWQAIQQDTVEGKGGDSDPATQMTEFLTAMEWLSDADKARVAGGQPAQAEPAKPAGPVPDKSGTIEQVMAYIGDDLARAQEVYDLEVARAKPRATLMNTLTAIGVKVQTPVETPAAQAPPAPAPAPEGASASLPAPQVTPEAPAAESQVSDDQMQAATVLLQDQLGAVPIDENGKAKGCDECGGAIDDEDIATLSATRFKRRLCVADYIAETKKPRG